MATAGGIEKRIRMREETDKGDVAKSLQSLVEKHYVSKRFKDIMGATRLNKTEVMIFSLLEMERRRTLIMSLSQKDVDAITKDSDATKEEKDDIKGLWALKQRMMRDPHAIAFTSYDSFMYMFGLGMQSHEGMSRREGVELVGGTYRRILDPEELGRFGRIKRRLFGDVLFPEQ